MLAALVAGLFAVATPANAVGSSPEGVPVNLGATTQPDVFRSNGLEGQPASDLTLAVDATHALTLVNGERIIVEVSDGLAQNCVQTTVGEFIGFASLPTVTVAAGSNVTVSAELASSTATNRLRSDTSDCSSGFTPTTQDQLIITVVNAPAPFGTAAAITISDIEYLVGSQAATGFATVRWAADVPPTVTTLTPSGANDGDSTPVHDVGPQGTEPAGYDGSQNDDLSTCVGTSGTPSCSGLNPGGISNAYITNLSVASPDAKAIRPGAGQTVGDFTLTETDFSAAHPTNPTVPGDPTVDGLCIQLIDPIVDFTDPGSVSVSGTDVAGAPVLIGSDIIRIPTSPGATPSMSTYTLSGVQVDTQQGNFGPQSIHVFQCDDGGNHNPTTDATGNPVANPEVTEYTNQPIVLLVVVNSERYAGIDRNDTARVNADRGFPCGFLQANGDQIDENFAIIARNDDFADALAANYIAGQLYAPILLVNTNGPIPQATLDALRVHGVTDVVIMGGPVAVGDDVAAQLDALTSFDCNGAARRTNEDLIRTINIQRVQGPTRFGTARQASLFTFGGNTIGFLDANNVLNPQQALRTAILASGRNFPDAMVGGPMSFQGVSDRYMQFTGNCVFRPELCDGFPIILSDGSASTLPADTEALITERNIAQVIIVGGTAAVPQSIQDQLEASGIKVIRLGGDNRRLTAITVAKFEIAVLGFQSTCGGWECTSFGHVALARGDLFPDSLTFGPVAGNDPNNTNIPSLVESPGLEPILLTENPSSVGAETLAFLSELASSPFDPETGFFESDEGFGLFIFWIDIVGGSIAITPAAENAALNALVG